MASNTPALVRQWVPTRTLSRTDIPRKSRMFWYVRATPSAVTWCGGSPWIGCPAKRMAPAVTGKTPVMRLNSVVLPAPFGPMTATSWPRATEKDTLFTARRPPKLLLTPSMVRKPSRAAELTSVTAPGRSSTRAASAPAVGRRDVHQHRPPHRGPARSPPDGRAS